MTLESLFNGGGASQFGIQAIGVLAYGVGLDNTLIGFGILKSTRLEISEEVEIMVCEEEHGKVDLKVVDSKQIKQNKKKY